MIIIIKNITIAVTGMITYLIKIVSFTDQAICYWNLS